MNSTEREACDGTRSRKLEYTPNSELYSLCTLVWTGVVVLPRQPTRRLPSQERRGGSGTPCLGFCDTPGCHITYDTWMVSYMTAWTAGARLEGVLGRCPGWLGWETPPSNPG